MMRKIKQAAVIGSGVMGGGIAALLAGAGIQTLLLDIVPFDLTDDEKKDPAARNRIVKAGMDGILNARPPALMHPKDVARIAIGNLEDDFDKLADCDWIIEVVVERLDIKQNLLKKIEPIRKAGAIVSTNTSGIPLAAMSKELGSDFRQHFLGTHFFNPVRYMHLLELIAGEETLPEVLEFMADFGDRMLGKGIVWAKDTPNFVGNRIGVHGSALAIQTMLEAGLTIPEADAMTGPALGRPKTATFKTGDLVGLDILAHVAQNTYDLVPDDEERERFKLPAFVSRMLENKLLGNKTRGGFYKKEKGPDGKKIRKVINPETLAYEDVVKPNFPCLAAAKAAKGLPDKIKAVVHGDDKGARYAWKVLAGSLIYAANRVPEIADTIVEIDNAMKWGYNFTLGPFGSWDAIGLPESVQRMEKEGMAVPEKVKKMLSAGNTSFYKTENGKVHYYDFASESYQQAPVSDRAITLSTLKDMGNTAKSCPSASLVDLGDGVFCCEFHTKMNALNSELIEFMHESMDYVDANGAGMVFGNQAGGMPGAFSAGADLLAVAMAALEGKFSDISQMIQRLQGAMQKARYAAFPVVAAPFGMALGGGCEIGLGSDRMVAHSELFMGLVEMGVGLLPAGGGCLNLWKKFTGTLPEAVTDADLTKFFVPVFTNIAMAKVSTSAADARANGFLGPMDRIVFNRDNLIGEAKKEVLKMVSDGYAPPLKQKVKVLGQTAQGMVNVQIADMQRAGWVSEYDAFLAKRIAYVISGGDVGHGNEIDEEVILKLEEEAFLDLL
ncbi:MAG: 3-hydroxyacyl-CoA dehydrogenase/enoyl-CoA hydratase family protein, partial [Deltaproteobacteria bacterium]|nr:3-hydroxyacyl-CoA dehydrogenase/enoyl-CoA hydratase family protein [Deltaproteobacteria bacterium]